jgi:GntR family transcriptional regulator of vanillate catabolism
MGYRGARNAGALQRRAGILRCGPRGGTPLSGTLRREQHSIIAYMNTQQTRALVCIREMILQGKLRAGQRVAEAPLAERLGMSRTPVRQALPVLAQEGLLVEHATRGYVVKEISTADIFDAIDVRGVIEGLAARRVAERGASRALCSALHLCLADGDRIFSKGHIQESDEAHYADMNARFHDLIVREARSPIIEQTLERNARIPFVGPQALAFDKTSLGRMYDMLLYAHRQHHFIVAAIERGESARVEALMREHANPVKDSLNLPGIKASQRQSNPPLTIVG